MRLNDSKTVFLIIGMERYCSKVSVDKIKVGQSELAPVSSVQNLGTWFDSQLRLAVVLFITCTISGILGRICPVNLLKGLPMRSLLRGWTILMAYCRVFHSIKLVNFKGS